MTAPTDLAALRLADLLDLAIDVRARGDVLDDDRDRIYAELKTRARTTFETDGVLPTWRGDPRLGQVIASAPRDKVAVTDEAAFTEWAATAYPTEVNAAIAIPAHKLQAVLDLLADHGIEPHGHTVAVQPAWQAAFLKVDGEHVVATDDGVLVAGTGELIPGVELQHGDPTRITVSVRTKPEAVARAAAAIAYEQDTARRMRDAGAVIRMDADVANAVIDGMTDEGAEPDDGDLAPATVTSDWTTAPIPAPHDPGPVPGDDLTTVASRILAGPPISSLTKPQLKGWLTELGVLFVSAAKRDELQGQLERAVARVAP